MTAMLKYFPILLAVVGIPSMMLAVGLNFSFYRLGTHHPDPATGHTYPYNMHGSMIYVSPLLGEVQLIAFFVGWICIAGLVATSFWLRRKSN